MSTGDRIRPSLTVAAVAAAPVVQLRLVRRGRLRGQVLCAALDDPGDDAKRPTMCERAAPT